MLELLLANHPLDCPVCDKGGECPLQDQAFSHGPGESRYVEEKRHFEKPIPISDLVLLDRERCILCDRCTRFADEVAGDPLIHFTQRGNETQVMTFPDQPFASYFSGNTVQICPVGALTAKPYRFKARPWDLERVETTCTTCSVGCRSPCSRAATSSCATSASTATRSTGAGCATRAASASSPSTRRPRWRSRSCAASRRPRADVVEHRRSTRGHRGRPRGARRRRARRASPCSAAPAGRTRTPSPGPASPTISASTATPSSVTGSRRGPRSAPGDHRRGRRRHRRIVLLGPDLKEELPVLLPPPAPRRHEAHGAKIVEFSPTRPAVAVRLAQPCATSRAAARGRERGVGRREIAASSWRAGPVVDRDRSHQSRRAGRRGTAWARRLRRRARRQPAVTVLPALRRGNVVGALQLGLAPAPTAATTRSASCRPPPPARSTLLVLLGADPINDCPDADLARRALAGARRVVAVDTFLTESAISPTSCSPAAAFGEKAGTTTNLEGRVSSSPSRSRPAGTARPDWMIAVELGLRLGDATSADEPTVVDADHRRDRRPRPGYAGATSPALAAAPTACSPSAPAGRPTPSTRRLSAAPPRNSYDYRLVVSRKLYDRGRRHRDVAVAAPLARRRGATSTRPTPTARRRRRRRRQASSAPSVTVVLPLVADAAVPRGIVWCRSTSRAAPSTRSSTPPPRSPTSGSRRP